MFVSSSRESHFTGIESLRVLSLEGRLGNVLSFGQEVAIMMKYIFGKVDKRLNIGQLSSSCDFSDSKTLNLF